MTLNEDDLDTLGRIADGLDYAAAGSVMPISADLMKTCLVGSKAMAYITSRALALGLVGGGARTFHIARDLNVSTAHARRVMLSLERAGKVSRSERYTAANDIYWVPVWPTLTPSLTLTR